MFELHRVVIHEVRKKAQENLTVLDLSATLAPQNLEIMEKLVESINTVYSASPSIKNTHFNPNADTEFSTFLKRYLQEVSDVSFYNFSVEAMQALKVLMEAELLATGGFYCFADYTDFGRRCVVVVLLRRKGGFNFVKVGNTFTASGAESLNFDKIATGFRLNVGIYEDDADARNSIALITSQQDQLSSYFKRWVSVAEIISNTMNTRKLVDLVKQLPMPVDENGANQFPSEDAFRKACYYYVEQSPQKRVSLMDMGAHFYGEERRETLLEIAEQQNIIIDNEFKRDKTAWQRVISIRASIPGLQLVLDHDKMNDGLVRLQGDQIVIHSPELVQQIRNQRNGQ